MTDRRALDRLFAGIKLNYKKTQAEDKINSFSEDNAEGKARKIVTRKKSQPKKSAKGKHPQGGSLETKENDLLNKYCALPLGRVQTPDKEDKIALAPQAEEQRAQARTVVSPHLLQSAEAKTASHIEHSGANTPEKKAPASKAGCKPADHSMSVTVAPSPSGFPMTPMQTPSPPAAALQGIAHSIGALEPHSEQIETMQEFPSPRTPATASGRGGQSNSKGAGGIGSSRFARAADPQALTGSPGSAMAISPVELYASRTTTAGNPASEPAARCSPGQSHFLVPKQRRPGAISQATREFLNQMNSEPQAGFWSDGSPMAISPAIRTGYSSGTASPTTARITHLPEDLPALARNSTVPGENTSGPAIGAGSLAQGALGSVCTTAGVPQGAARGAQVADSAAQSPLEAYKAAVAAARARSKAAAAARAPTPAALPHEMPDRQSGGGFSIHVMQPAFAQGQATNKPVPCGVRSPADARRLYKSFPRQQDALNYADACNRAAASGGSREAAPEAEGSRDAGADPPAPYEEIVRVWCEEQNGNRGYFRTFLAASYASFWERYIRLHPTARHFYEVIPQQRPCHLYFDLEFLTACNPGISGESLVDSLLQLVAEGLRQYWGLELRKEHLVELDSSTPEKFSRHIIVHIPGHAFESNIMAGSFVQRLLSMPQGAQLTVRKTPPTEASQVFTSFVDTAVYTKNRHFRVMGSCKGGKTAVLCNTGRFSTEPEFKEAFLASLVCNVPAGCRLLAVEPVSRVAKGVVRSAAESAQRLGTLQAGGNAVVVSRKCDEVDCAVPPAQRYSFEEVQRWAEAARPFVEAVAKRRSGGRPATVRTMAHCGTAATVAFSMLGPGSHFCENIGRFHHNNHVFFVLNFAQGVFCQKCHDPDCSNFRSAWMPMPLELCHQQAGYETDSM